MFVIFAFKHLFSTPLTVLTYERTSPAGAQLHAAYLRFHAPDLPVYHWLLPGYCRGIFDQKAAPATDPAGADPGIDVLHLTGEKMGDQLADRPDGHRCVLCLVFSVDPAGIFPKNTDPRADPDLRDRAQPFHPFGQLQGICPV